MVAILTKDLFQLRWLLLGALMVLLLLAVFLPVDAPVVLTISQYPVVLLVSSVLTVILPESREEKSQGYAFLASLPISRVGIVAVKFFLLLMVCGVLGGFSWLTSTIKYADFPIHGLLSLLVSLSIGGALVVGALFYTGTYCLGLARFTRVALVAMMLVQVAALYIGLQQFRGWSEESPMAAILENLLAIHPGWYLGAALAAWLTLLGFTTIFRKRI
ncbi:MAG: ABC-2 transporter permease [Anaerolineae bacterium]|nr:ABC-2 transporter permease [Anaerolineae bacterium]